MYVCVPILHLAFISCPFCMLWYTGYWHKFEAVGRMVTCQNQVTCMLMLRGMVFSCFLAQLLQNPTAFCKYTRVRVLFPSCAPPHLHLLHFSPFPPNQNYIPISLHYHSGRMYFKKCWDNFINQYHWLFTAAVMWRKLCFFNCILFRAFMRKKAKNGMKQPCHVFMYLAS